MRLKDVANVIDGVQNDKTIGWYNGNPGIILAVMRQPGTNTIQVVDRVKELLPMFKEIMPSSVHLDIFMTIRNLFVTRSMMCNSP